jgi:hypothetical protein
MLPVGDEAAEGLCRLVDAWCEKRSLAVGSSLHPAGFDEIMPKSLAARWARYRNPGGCQQPETLDRRVGAERF